MKSSRFQSLRVQLKRKLFRTSSESPMVTPEQPRLISKESFQALDLEDGTPHFQTQDEMATPQIVKIKNVVHDELEFAAIYEEFEMIGQGGHAIVKKCRRKDDPLTEYAVKIYRTGDPEIINTIKKAFQNQVCLHHPNCCRALELFIDERTEEIHVVQEYVSWPSLETLLQMRKRLSIEIAHQIVQQLLQTVQYLHKVGISHRDIKPDNLLVLVQGSSVKIKLIDFGVSKRFYQQKTKTKVNMWTRTGNIFYQAPEIFDITGYNEKVDIWSIGVVFYQILVGQLPFIDDQIIDTIELIQQAKLPQEVINRFPKLMRDFFKRILAPSPDYRLSAKECLLHPIFQTDSKSEDNIRVKVRDDVSIDLGHNETDLDFEKTRSNTFVGNEKNLSEDLLQPRSVIHHIEKLVNRRLRFRTFSVKTDKEPMKTPTTPQKWNDYRKISDLEQQTD